MSDAPDFGSMLIPYLDRLAAPMFEANRTRRASIASPEAWWQRRRELVDAFEHAIGRFPDRNPLEAEVVGEVVGAGYVIEKVVFQSRPRFYVTANLYRPEHVGLPVPGIVVPCGHSENGKAHPAYQAVCIGLALKGYVALIYDPLGQGERKQYWDPVEGKSAVGGCCAEHSFAENQCQLTGTNVAQYMIWDTMRAIDYLLSRAEVDPARIGCTGCSGGGTNTAYVQALDERIQVSAPVCYVTTLQARQETQMIADGEQNFEAQVAAGLDHHEYCMMVAPRAVQIFATEEDFFPIRGARETAAATAALYETLGIPERAALSVSPGGHGFSAAVRESVFAWFDRWFGVEGREIPDPEQLVRPDADLYCTASGQVATSLRGETVFTLNARRAVDTRAPQPMLTDAASARAYQSQVIEAVRRLTAYQLPRDVTWRVLASEEHEGFRRERLSITVAPGLELPAYALIPARLRAGAGPILCASDDGAAALTHATGSLAQHCAEAGAVLLAIDPRGMGEAAGKRRDGFEASDDLTRHLLGQEAYAAYHCQILGQPLLGMRAADLVAGAEVLSALAGGRERGIGLIGEGRCGIIALHAAALCGRFVAVTVFRSLWSYRLAVETKLCTALHAADTLHGVLAEYDLPALAAAVAPRNVRIETPLSAAGVPLCVPELPAVQAEDYGIADRVHRLLDGALSILP